MAARDGPGRDPPAHVAQWWLVPLGLVALLIVVGLMVANTLGRSDPSTATAGASDKEIRKLPPYWTVRRGQTYSQIAAQTGLSIDQLETFNPRTDPATIVPGQRLKLRLHAPKPPPKPLGPRFWTVRAGQSYGSIAARTGKRIATLQRLNPRLKTTALKPGDRVRLRR